MKELLGRQRFLRVPLKSEKKQLKDLSSKERARGGVHKTSVASNRVD